MKEQIKTVVDSGISFVLQWKHHEALWGRRDFLVQLCQDLEDQPWILRAAPGQLHGFSLYLNCNIDPSADRQLVVACAQCLIREHCEKLAKLTQSDPFPLEVTVRPR